MSELTKKIREAMEDGTIVHRYPSIKAICDEHERLEAELTLAQKRDVDNFTTCAEYVTTKKTIFLDLEAIERTIQVANNPMVVVRLLVEEIHQLRRAHERLEAEHENLRGACATAMAERDAFCSLTTQATRELERLEGLLGTLGKACARRNDLVLRCGSSCTAEQWDELTEANVAVDDAREPVYAEAVRLAKEKP